MDDLLHCQRILTMLHSVFSLSLATFERLLLVFSARLLDLSQLFISSARSRDQLARIDMIFICLNTLRVDEISC
ncbi:MAG: hypothetical protein CMN98_00145 [Synechococcus sp. NP17]|nr:hypothetical protein [Synechococcus sp. NP17]